MKITVFATKALRHEAMICLLNHSVSYGYGIHKFHRNLGALVSLWLNELYQSFLLDQTGSLRPAAGLKPDKRRRTR